MTLFTRFRLAGRARISFFDLMKQIYCFLPPPRARQSRASPPGPEKVVVTTVFFDSIVTPGFEGDVGVNGVKELFFLPPQSPVLSLVPFYVGRCATKMPHPRATRYFFAFPYRSLACSQKHPTFFQCPPLRLPTIFVDGLGVLSGACFFLQAFLFRESNGSRARLPPVEP